MDILAALDEMRSLNARHERLDPEAALAALRQQAETNEEALEADDEAAIREYVLQRSRVKRVQEPDEGVPSGSCAFCWRTWKFKLRFRRKSGE